MREEEGGWREGREKGEGGKGSGGGRGSQQGRESEKGGHNKIGERQCMRLVRTYIDSQLVKKHL